MSEENSLNLSTKNGLINFFKFIQFLCRDSKVWKEIFVFIIAHFKFDKDAFYKMIIEPPKEFESHSIQKRYLEIYDFYNENSHRIDWDKMTLALPDNKSFPEIQLSDLLDELHEYLKTKAYGLKGLERELIWQMVSDNTYSYIDDGIIVKFENYPHFDFYKEDLSKIPLKSDL